MIQLMSTDDSTYRAGRQFRKSRSPQTAAIGREKIGRPEQAFELAFSNTDNNEERPLTQRSALQDHDRTLRQHGSQAVWSETDRNKK